MANRNSYLFSNDCIAAPATPPGTGALAIIRISGQNSFSVVSKIFKSPLKDFTLEEQPTHTIHYGHIYDGQEIVDEVMLSIFREPRSYTGENSAEISCHGSEYIQKKILELMIINGARLANPGEFTLRAFLKGRFDLSGAEAVADLIASQSKLTHDLAIRQMKGGFSGIINNLRKRLLDFSSLIELELDFSEEDVEFANRHELIKLLDEVENDVTGLVGSFALGNVINRGIPVAIAGKPNSGKSTLLNALLNEERAIVSEIPGTTRDAIEDTVTYEGITFRFIDTAGLRHTVETIEAKGIERTYQAMAKAMVVLYIFDISGSSAEEIIQASNELKTHLGSIKETDEPDKQIILIGNKTDLLVESPQHFSELVEMDCIFISAKRKENINLIFSRLLDFVSAGIVKDQAILTNVRHYDALNKVLEATGSVRAGLLNNLPTDLIAADLRNALHYLGEITGEITTDELLGNIFGKFCIGK